MKQFSQIVKGPPEALKPRTLVELLGRSRVLIEHHKGILGYGSEEIAVGATYGMVIVSGQELRLCCMSKEQIFISGRIENLRLEGNG